MMCVVQSPPASGAVCDQVEAGYQEALAAMTENRGAPT